MDFHFLIGYRQCGVEDIPIKVKYIIKGRQINFTTNIVAVAIDLLDGKLIKNHWCLRLLVPIRYSSSQAFILFVQSFIRTVFITVDVLYSIGALELMKFQNKIEDYDLCQEAKSTLDNLRTRMLLMGITIIKLEDLFFGGATFYDEQKLVMFRYKEEDEEYILKCRHRKVCLEHFILLIFLNTFIILICSACNIMPSSSRTEYSYEYASNFITNPKTTKATLSNV